MRGLLVIAAIHTLQYVGSQVLLMILYVVTCSVLISGSVIAVLFQDIASEHPERFFVGEIVREKIFIQYRNEVPYACQVQRMLFTQNYSFSDFRVRGSMRMYLQD